MSKHLNRLTDLIIQRAKERGYDLNSEHGDQRQLSRDMGLSEAYINGLLKGGLRSTPRQETLTAFKRVLGIDADELLDAAGILHREPREFDFLEFIDRVSQLPSMEARFEEYRKLPPDIL